MKVGLVMPYWDEQDTLVETLRALGPGLDSVVVVDDASKEGVEEEVCKSVLPGGHSLSVVRSEERIGCCPARNIGAGVSDVDVLIFMDAHMRISGEALREMAREANARWGIVQAVSGALPLHSKFRGFGGRFLPSEKAFLAVGWHPEEPFREIERRDAVLGACYAIPKPLFHKIGGFMDNTGWWGFTEEVLSLKAWLAGIPIYLKKSALARHFYKSTKTRSEPIPNPMVWKSRIAALRICSGDEYWEERLVPFWDKRVIKHYKLEEFLHSEEMEAERAHFAKAKVRDMFEFDEKFLWSSLVKPQESEAKHYALVRCHNFPEQELVLDEVGKVVDSIIAITNEKTTPGVKEVLRVHSKVEAILHDEHKGGWTQKESYERAFKMFAEGFGDSAETVYYLDHDELPPAGFLEERERFLKSDAEVMGFHYLFPWRSPDMVVRPDIPVHNGPLYKLVKWNDSIGWEPYQGCCLPSGTSKKMTCKRPMRHLAFMKTEWRERKLAQKRTKAYGKGMDWLRLEEPVVVEYDGRDWDRWMVSPDSEKTAEHNFAYGKGARSRNEAAIQRILKQEPEKGLWLDLGTRDGWVVERVEELGFKGVGVEFHEETALRAVKEGRNVKWLDMRDKAVEDESCSVVSLFHTLEHVLDQETVAEAIWSALAVGGIVSIEVPKQASLKKGHMSYVSCCESLARLFPLTEVLESLEPSSRVYFTARKVASGPRLPGVSAMCCSYGRTALLEEAIECFLRQDYKGPKELVVLNDLEGLELRCDASGVVVANLPRRMGSFGEKRHAIIGMCKHQLLFPWDDDDIHLPHRISKSVGRIGRDGYWKPSEAWSLGTSKGGGLEVSRNQFHAQGCYRKALYYSVGGYPPQEQSTDTVLEQALVASNNRLVEDMSPEELFYIYRWGSATPAVPHLSGHKADKFKAWADVQPKGLVHLNPHWDQDYLGLVREELESGS